MYIIMFKTMVSSRLRAHDRTYQERDQAQNALDRRMIPQHVAAWIVWVEDPTMGGKPNAVR